MKKIIALALVLCLVLGIGAMAEGKGVINVMSFTDEVPGMITKYMEAHPEVAEKYDVNTTIVATTDGLYQPALTQQLVTGGADAPDIYCAEAAFVLKFTQGDAAEYAATYEDLGIDVDAAIEAADIAQYTIDIGTRPSDGKVVGLGYQATGGAFIYRRSIAKDVWGDDSPEFVAEKIGAGSGNWDAFFAAAAELKEKGYAIVSGDGDIWHAVENSSETGWVVDGVLNIDPAREAFLDLSKELKDNGYHHDTQDWQEGWFADMKKNGGVFGFYGPAWLINYTIGANCGEGDDSSYGDWAVCAPNIGFFWGGTWVLAGKTVVGTEKAEVVADIIKWITLDCDEDSLQYKWANGTLNGEGGTKDTVASGTVMAMSNGEMDFLAGQNMFDVFVPANQYANGKNLTQNDETINTYWRDAVRQYTSGALTRDEAIAAFKANVADNLDVEVE
ncbi:MAG: carbohydrate ABC transporter substrate-binding protein [Clostridia bacterium]|nr:carbohydrate ABC transporter substrate-binding protein [Clostridia bacterium]